MSSNLRTFSPLFFPPGSLRYSLHFLFESLASIGVILFYPRPPVLFRLSVPFLNSFSFSLALLLPFSLSLFLFPLSLSLTFLGLFYPIRGSRSFHNVVHFCLLGHPIYIFYYHRLLDLLRPCFYSHSTILLYYLYRTIIF